MAHLHHLDIERNNHTTDTLDYPLFSPARPLEPHHTLVFSLGEQEILEHEDSSTGVHRASISEPSSPKLPLAASTSNSEIEACTSPGVHQSKSTPSSPTLGTASLDAFQETFPDREFFEYERFLINGESSSRNDAPSDMCKAEHDPCSALSDGEFLNNKSMNRAPAPRPPLAYDVSHSSIVSEDKLADDGPQRDIENARACGVFVSPILEQAGFPGSLSDGEFLNASNQNEDFRLDLLHMAYIVPGLQGGGSVDIAVSGEIDCACGAQDVSVDAQSAPPGETSTPPESCLIDHSGMEVVYANSEPAHAPCHCSRCLAEALRSPRMDDGTQSVRSGRVLPNTPTAPGRDLDATPLGTPVPDSDGLLGIRIGQDSVVDVAMPENPSPSELVRQKRIRMEELHLEIDDLKAEIAILSHIDPEPVHAAAIGGSSDSITRR